MKFRDHTYKWMHPFMSTAHQWSFRGPRGGLHLHVSIMDERDRFPDPSCGLEFHHMDDTSEGHEPPHHTDCWLIGGRCWHDGTSLYAGETVWPRVERLMPDHAAIFRYLEQLYCEHFEREGAFDDQQ